jgi:DNA-binding XRE family transcriptional regulator
MTRGIPNKNSALPIIVITRLVRVIHTMFQWIAGTSPAMTIFVNCPKVIWNEYRDIEDVIADMPERQQQDVEALYQKLYAEELTLQQLRKAQKLTQESMAETLNIRQGNISKIEKRTDMMLTTLRSYVEAMGGELDLVVRFPDGQPVSLVGLGENTGQGGMTKI